MRRVLIVCQAGISTSYLTKKIDEYIQNEKCDMFIKAISVHETRQELEENSYDLLLFTPQLRFLYKSYLKEYEDELEIELIDIEDMASMNIGNIITGICGS